MVSPEDREWLEQFLDGYWNQTAIILSHGDDDVIVDEIVREATPDDLATALRVIETFLAAPESAESKAKFIGDAAFWRYFPEDDPTAPVVWLQGILRKLQERSDSPAT
jgi:hypothetical protein